MRTISDYTTPEAVGLQLAKTNPDTLPSVASAEYDDFFENVTLFCRQFSQIITQQTDRVFVPYKSTFTYSWAEMLEYQMIDRTARRRLRMRLPDDCLVLSGITWNSTLLSATDYFEVGVSELIPFPYSDVIWAQGYEPAQLTELDSVSIEGTWGYHNNLSQAYTVIETGVTINSSSTTLNVADAALYQTLQYIRLENELMQITARDEANDDLTVIRGVNGTTAEAHTSVSVERFNVHAGIALAATRGVSWLWQNRNSIGNVLQIGEGNVLLDEMPRHVSGAILMLRRVNALSV